MKKQKIFKIVNENGTFEGTRLYKVAVESKAEFSKKYKIYEDNVLVEIVTRDLDKKGNIIR
jgi:hypothetical protein